MKGDGSDDEGVEGILSCLDPPDDGVNDELAAALSCLDPPSPLHDALSCLDPPSPQALRTPHACLQALQDERACLQALQGKDDVDSCMRKVVDSHVSDDDFSDVLAEAVAEAMTTPRTKPRRAKPRPCPPHADLKKKKNKKKTKKKKELMNGKLRASFKASRSRSKCADESYMEVPPDMPQAALPSKRRGRANYTVHSPNAAKIGVLLENKAFFIMASAGAVKPTTRPHISWSKIGIEKAWERACAAANFQ